MHAEHFMKIFSKILDEKIPVAFLSAAPILQAVENAKELRDQGLNVTNLVVVDATPSVNVDFNVVHVLNAAKIYPQPEYVFVMEEAGANIAVNFFGNSKIIMSHNVMRLSSEQAYDVFMDHLDELREVYESLIDEESKKTFRGYWLGCTASRIDKIVHANTPQYFLEGFTPKAGDIFIDGGCFDGYTAAQFAALGCKVYSFEMNKDNYAVARKLAAEKNFVLENLGLGSYEHKIGYVNAESSSHIDPDGTEIATITTLDNYVREKNLPRVDAIKLDVEGSELDVLKGAAMSIACWKPLLLISAYHKPDDFWTLMNFVKSVRSDYKFAMRHYTAGYYACNEEDKFLFESLGINIRKLCYVECVLFAR